MRFNILVCLAFAMILTLVAATKVKGVVTSYSDVKKLGYITPDDSPDDIIIVNAKNNGGDSFSLDVGQPVEFNIFNDPEDGRSASDIVLLPYPGQ